jgi:hypothetical protein
VESIIHARSKIAVRAVPELTEYPESAIFSGESGYTKDGRSRGGNGRKVFW